LLFVVVVVVVFSEESFEFFLSTVYGTEDISSVVQLSSKKKDNSANRSSRFINSSLN